jgi:general secretion pathway protein I
MLSSLRQRHGFSLFEVLIAMAIMSSASMLMYTAWTGNQMRVRKMSINNKAALLLEQIMAELEIKYAERFLQLPESEGGAFDDHPRYTWRMQSRDFEMPDLRAVLISEGDGDEAMLLIIDRLTEFLNQSVKEVKVTVEYSYGKKSDGNSIKYSATTFFVDFNQALPIGGAGSGG